MKAEIIKRCSVICESGSIVEISEGQFKALGDFAKAVKAVKEPDAEPVAEAEKKTVKKAEKKKEA